MKTPNYPLSPTSLLPDRTVSQFQSLEVSELGKTCRSTVIEALKLGNARSGSFLCDWAESNSPNISQLYSLKARGSNFFWTTKNSSISGVWGSKIVKSSVRDRLPGKFRLKLLLQIVSPANISQLKSSHLQSHDLFQNIPKRPISLLKWCFHYTLTIPAGN